MRIGALWYPIPGAEFRAYEPLLAMERRGHEVVWPADGGTGDVPLGQLVGCDVVHVYRRFDPATLKAMADLTGRGTRIVYDNDDDFRELSPSLDRLYRSRGGPSAAEMRDGERAMTRAARIVTTTTEHLARRFRADGVARVVSIPNALPAEFGPVRASHEGLIVGWMGGREHLADARALGIEEALTRVRAAHPEVRVETIGLALDLDGAYRHHEGREHRDLPHVLCRFDIGIAPLADTPFNQGKSDIKLKEYAACGVPWLASATGPYLEHGEEHGGRLVGADGWVEAVGGLARSKRDRRRLAKQGLRWAKTQRTEAFADQWEAVFREAAGSSS